MTDKKGSWDHSAELEEHDEHIVEEARTRDQYFPHLRPGVAPREPDLPEGKEDVRTNSRPR